MTEQRVSSRYALALMNTAKQENLVEKVFEDFQLVKSYIDASRELKYLLKSPVVGHFKKKSALKDIFEGKIHILTLNFLLLLADKRREEFTLDIIFQFEKQYNEVNGLLPVDITSAIELDEVMKSRINVKLNSITGKKVLSNYIIDKSIKGGVQVRIENWVYDASLANQLKALHKSLAEGSL